MEKKDFYLLIDNACDLTKGTIKGDESLQDEIFFDSLALLALIATLDKNFNLTLNTDEIRTAGTVNDLFDKIPK